MILAAAELIAIVLHRIGSLALLWTSGRVQLDPQQRCREVCFGDPPAISIAVPVQIGMQVWVICITSTACKCGYEIFESGLWTRDQVPAYVLGGFHLGDLGSFTTMVGMAWDATEYA